MASHARQLLQDVLRALRQDHEHYDLSTEEGTDRVVIDEGEPPVITGPWVSISAAEVLPGQGAITPLTQYEVTGEISWYAFTASDLESTEQRAFEAMDLGNDVVSALQAAHADPTNYPVLGACHEILWGKVLVSGDASVGDVPYGVAYSTFSYKALVQRGI